MKFPGLWPGNFLWRRATVFLPDAQHQETDEGKAPDQSAEGEGPRGAQHSGGGIVPYRRQRQSVAEQGADRHQHRVVEDIQAEAAPGHEAGEGGLPVPKDLAPAQKSQNDGPEVQVGPKALEALWGGEVRAVKADHIHRARGSGGGQHGDAEPHGGVLNLIMGEDIVPHQKDRQVDAEAVHGEHGHIPHLGRAPEGEEEQGKGRGAHPSAQLPQPVIPVQAAEKNKQAGEEKEHLDEPQRPDAAEYRDGVEQGSGNIGERASGVEVEQSGDPVDHEEPQSGGNEQLVCPLPQELPGRPPLQGVPGAHPRDEEEERHEPGVNDVHGPVKSRDALRAGQAAGDAHAIEEVAHMVEQDQHHDSPAEIVQIVPSHTGSSPFSPPSKMLAVIRAIMDLGGMASPRDSSPSRSRVSPGLI